MGQSAKNQRSGFFLFSCFLFFRIDRKKKKTGTAQQYFRDMPGAGVEMFVCLFFQKSQPWVYS